ncbi:GH-E family nuclease [Olsenella sp. Marseille-P4559]|uniref:GH-E family nuclease n=1 Tax=Olsenella sp. Marseille-P4559 TaxID=2364795 RepID=UPI001F5EFF36|nr:GH-E family nuclease [Olsenella sp. Marseille-P4559]
MVDFGHVPGEEYWRSFERYRSGEWSLGQLREHEFNSDNFQLEAPSANRSHRYEAKG